MTAATDPATTATATATSATTTAATCRRRRSEGPTAEERLVASLIELLEAGTSPWRRPWDATAGGHHVNLFSGHRYRGGNPVLLELALARRGSDLPYWCGFAEARAQGLAPRRGSRAALILRPQRIGPAAPLTEAAASADSTDPAPRPAESAPAPAPRILWRPVAVFHATDLVGEALPACIARRRAAERACLRPEPERLQAAEAVLGRWPVPVVHGGDRACYLPAADRIHLPERRAFPDPAALYATWAHEAVHSTGHPSRLARDLAGAFGSPAYAREELVAELGTALLGDRLEIGSPIAHHAAYLGSWIELLRESPRVLFRVLVEARRAADLIAPEDPPLSAARTAADPPQPVLR